MPLNPVLEPAGAISAPAAASPSYIVEQRGPFSYAVLGPNPDAGKPCVPYSGSHLTVCTTDGREDAKMIADALNARVAR